MFVIKVLLTTPTTPTERMKRIVEASEGFIYLVRSLSVHLSLCRCSYMCVSVVENVLGLTGELNRSDWCTSICEREGSVALEGYQRGLITSLLLFLHHLDMMLKFLKLFGHL